MYGTSLHSYAAANCFRPRCSAFDSFQKPSTFCILQYSRISVDILSNLSCMSLGKNRCFRSMNHIAAKLSKLSLSRHWQASSRTRGVLSRTRLASRLLTNAVQFLALPIWQNQTSLVSDRARWRWGQGGNPPTDFLTLFPLSPPYFTPWQLPHLLPPPASLREAKLCSVMVIHIPLKTDQTLPS